MTVKVAIVGSCVTRDAFVGVPGFTVVYYRARTGVLSIYADPVAISDEELMKVPGNFGRKCIATDFRKGLLTDLRAASPDIVIVDFIDERFGLFRAGHQAVTYSWDMYRVGLGQVARAAGLRACDKFAPENYVAFMEAARRFFADMAAIAGPEKLFLHQALFADRFLNKKGAVQDFNAEKRAMGAKHNKMILDLSAQSAGAMDQRNIINEMAGTRADMNHTWSLAPFHYEKSYYQRVIATLSNRLGIEALRENAAA